MANAPTIPSRLCPAIVFMGELAAKLHPVAVGVNRVRRVVGGLHEFLTVPGGSRPREANPPGIIVRYRSIPPSPLSAGLDDGACMAYLNAQGVARRGRLPLGRQRDARELARFGL